MVILGALLPLRFTKHCNNSHTALPASRQPRLPSTPTAFYFVHFILLIIPQRQLKILTHILQASARPNHLLNQLPYDRFTAHPQSFLELLIPHSHARECPVTGVEVEWLEASPDCVDGGDAEGNHVGDGPHEGVGYLAGGTGVRGVC